MLKLLDGRRVEINGTYTTTVTSIEITLLRVKLGPHGPLLLLPFT